MQETTAQTLERVGLIPVLRARNAGQAHAVVQAMLAGGVTVVEVTMTDGGVILLSQPDCSALEIKKFDAHDGQGLTLAQTAGLRTGCITGRESSALLRRAREMKMEFIYMKQPVKMPAYEEILMKAGVSDSVVAFVGDDLPDIPLLRRAGLAIAVGDAVPEVKDAARSGRALPQPQADRQHAAHRLDSQPQRLGRDGAL